MAVLLTGITAAQNPISRLFGGSAKPKRQKTEPNSEPEAKPATRDRDVPTLPASLARNPDYAEYAAILIQLDLLSNPSTASLPITVSAGPQGNLTVAGTVPAARARQAVIAAAKRISGLPIRDELSVSPQEKGAGEIELPSEKLERLAVETIGVYFPSSTARIRITAEQRGGLVVNGSVDSYGEKLMVSKALKGLPGARSVTNRLMVSIDGESGMLAVDELKERRLRAADLPTIPAGSVVAWDAGLSTGGDAVRDMIGRPAAADDDLGDRQGLDRQLREEVKILVDREPGITCRDYTIDASSGVVTITGDLRTRENVEKCVEIALGVNGVRKVVAKCEPVSIQRSAGTPIEERAKAKIEAAAEESKPPSLLGLIPGLSRDDDRGKRDAIRRAIRTACEKRISDLAVERTPSGLHIEGKVASIKDRNFTLRAIDRLPELKRVDYTVTIRVEK
jgi:osmotically-inducible protein OsmY